MNMQAISLTVQGRRNTPILGGYKPGKRGNGEEFDRVDWSQALSLPCFFYGSASAVLSGATAYAKRFPAGGVMINPGGGLHRNPEWTRYLSDGTVLRQLQPILAGFSAGVHLVRALNELKSPTNSRDPLLKWAGALDLGLSATSALSMVSPGAGSLASAGLLIARAILDIEPSV